MAKITAIETDKRSPIRVKIHLDGEFAFNLTRLAAAWLKVGQELTEDKIAALQTADERERAYQQALVFLSYRPRSASEIRQNLRKHAFPETVIEPTLERLEAERLSDDRQFARVWVENRNTHRPRSRRALTLELRRKGIPEAAAQASLKDLDDETLAYQAGLKKGRRMESLEWAEFRRKMSDFLARRGFSYSVLAPVVARLWNEAHAEQHLFEDEESL